MIHQHQTDPNPSTSAAKPNRSSPTAGRISSRNKSSVAPVVRLPPIKAEPPDVPDEDEPPPTVGDSDDTNEAHEDDIPLSELAKKLRGTFMTKEHVLEKKVETHKYQMQNVQGTVAQLQSFNGPPSDQTWNNLL